MATTRATFAYPIGTSVECTLTDGAVKRGYAYFRKVEVDQMFPQDCLGERSGVDGKARRQGLSVTFVLDGCGEMQTDMAQQGLQYRPGSSLAAFYRANRAAADSTVRLTCIGPARYRIEIVAR